jgi:hypothetical protein
MAETEDIGLSLGDTIVILGGKLNKTRGKLYEFSADRFSILPNGATDRIIKVNLIDGSPDPDYGITDIKRLKKASVPGFVNMVDLRAGQKVETFTSGEGGESVAGPIFEVIAVDEEADSATFKDEAGSETDIVFGGTGIPRDMPFEVIRTLEPDDVPAPVGEEAGAEAAAPSMKTAVDEDDVAEEGQAPSLAEEAEEEAQAEAQGPELEEDDFLLGNIIELPVDEEVKEISSAFRVYQDVFQRSEMLGQLIRDLPQSQQRNPVKLQQVRRLVEMMIIMRNEVVKYGQTGEPRGLNPTSISTLAELIIRPDVSLARKVANVSKVLYLDHTALHTNTNGEEGKNPDPGQLEDGLYADYLADVVRQSDVLNKTAAMWTGEEGPGIGMPRFYQDLERYKAHIQTPYRIVLGEVPVFQDEEVFRLEVPNEEEPNLNVLASYPEKDSQIFNPPMIIQHSFAITRLLRNRIVRFLTGEPLRVVENGEVPSYDNVLIFPLKTLRDLGPIRSGSLAQDSSLSMAKPNSMEEILKGEDIGDYLSADGILNLGVKGIVGNVMISDWLKELKLEITGLGDTLTLLRGYGVQGIEWNMEQAQVLQERIEQYTAQLRIFIAKQREENNATLANLRFEPQQLLAPEQAARLISRIESEPLLHKILETVRNYMGDLANIDINWFTYLFLSHPDLLIATLGQKADVVARERLRYIRDQFSASITAAYRTKKRLENAGEIPQENSCPHVQALEKSRQVALAAGDEPKDLTKMKSLLKVLNKYRGPMKDEWVWCNNCPKHLICGHELLQIQEFSRPKEKDVIHKELILKYAGGEFSGKFICRVCGQGIQELDFETSIEFDDAGHPMMGRAVLVDEEAIRLEALDDLLNGPEAEEEQQLSFGSEESDLMYKTFKKLSGLVGINPEEKDYRSMVNELSSYASSSLYTRAQYITVHKGKKVPDYDVYYSIRYVAAAAAILLMNIQTHTPDYIIYYTNAECREGFFGYPMEAETNQTGLQCMSAVVAGINDDEFPWNMTTIQKKGNLVQRRDFIQPTIKALVDVLMKNPVLQTRVKRKKEYRVKIYGSEAVGGMKRDSISPLFRPVPYIENATSDPIVADAATPEKQAIAWIRSAHGAASTSAALNPDSLHSETTCCLHNIRTTGDWSKLPQLEPRTNLLEKQTRVTTTFNTEPPKSLEGKLEADDYYKLFVRVCYKGDNKGLPHELGIGLTCSRCDLSFQENPYLPLEKVNPNPAKQREEESKIAKTLTAHIETQGVVVSEDAFNDLVTSTRQRGIVSKDVPIPLPRKDNIIYELSQKELVPFEGWERILEGIQTSILDIGPQATSLQIATACEELVAIISEKEEFISSRIGKEPFEHLQILMKKHPRECGENISAYLLLPFQRMVTGVTSDSFKILGSYELSRATRDDIMIKGLGAHLQGLGGMRSSEELKGLTLEKVRTLVKQLSFLCIHILQDLRSVLVPGGSEMVSYLIRGYVVGILHQFLDPHTIPEPSMGGGAAEADAAPNLKLLYYALRMCLGRFAVGSRIPSEDEIRLRIEQRAEQEKQVFVKKRETMSKDQRMVSKMNQKLGLAEWAVGGTMAIKKYDDEQYERDREQRAAAGIVDYVAAQAEPGRPTDMFGMNFEQEYDARGSGYDHDQMAEEDY